MGRFVRDHQPQREHLQLPQKRSAPERLVNPWECALTQQGGGQQGPAEDLHRVWSAQERYGTVYCQMAGGAQLTPGRQCLINQVPGVSLRLAYLERKDPGVCPPRRNFVSTQQRQAAPQFVQRGAASLGLVLGKSDFELRQSSLQEMGEEGGRILTKSDDGLGWM